MEKIDLLLERQIRTEKSTIGSLSVNGKFFCFILEDKDRGLKDSMTLAEVQKLKVYGITAIPTGNYKVTLTYSPKFKKILPLVNNVKGYEGIRIHPGNKEQDSLGCLLTGYKHGQDSITAGTSATAFNDLMKILTPAKEITIQIV